MTRRIIQGILAISALCLLVLGMPWYAAGFQKTYFCASSVLGLAGLFLSIVSEPRIERGPLRWIAAVGLISGAQLYVYLLSSWASHFYDVGDYLFVAWLLGGPLVVAIWNLILLLKTRKGPNKAQEPTPRPVTPPAELRVAPGRGPAHL